jgi:hypothetical protein
MVDELMPNDTELANSFLRSDHWVTIREREGFKRKRVMKKAIRAYLTAEYAWFKRPDESVELEKYVGRIEYLIRSRWSKKGARTKAKNRRLRVRKLTRLAVKAHLKYLAAKKSAAARKYIEASPLLFEGLPTQKKPLGNVA